jgi:hypothetical protein
MGSVYGGSTAHASAWGRCDEDAECALPGTCRNEHAELHGSVPHPARQQQNQQFQRERQQLRKKQNDQWN